MRRLLPLLLWLAGCTLSDTAADSVRDPVCGTVVDKKTAIFQSYDRHAYWFDSQACVEKFLEHPARYVDQSHYIFRHND